MWNVMEDTLKSFIQTIYSFFTRRSKIHRGIRNKVLHLNLQRVSICKHRQLNKLRNYILCIIRVRSLLFLNTGSSKSAYSTYYLMKLVFRLSLFYVFSVFSMSWIWCHSFRITIESLFLWFCSFFIKTISICENIRIILYKFRFDTY